MISYTTLPKKYFPTILASQCSLINISQVEYIWSGMKRSFPKLLYIIARYSSLCYLLSANLFRCLYKF
ncbi:hypothetical protein BDQ17DRAFT_1376211 [Cyathus striatus]|nr:hypothetical protein BDQ17DRAFT_1376211 [Cyathus striatus]